MGQKEPNDDVQLLEQLPLFRGLADDSRKGLLAGVRFHECAADDLILRQGQQASGAYIVLEGCLRVYSLSPAGKEATLYNIDAGETCVLALNCLFNDLLYPAWVEAEMPTRVAMVPGGLYRDLFSKEPSVQDLTVRMLSTLVFRLMEELEQVHGMNMRQRLASLLLVRASSTGELDMTQQQLAQRLGTRREVVARLMGEFAERGYLSTGRKHITLLDTEGLRLVVTPEE